MAYLTIEELKTHLYKDNIDVITRGDDTIVVSAIDSAIQEAKGYLAHYDREAIFEATGGERNAHLHIFVKDIASWHLVNLCNAGTDLQLRESRYLRAIDWLKGVQANKVNPDLPIVDEDGDGKSDLAGEYLFGSNPKRKQHF
ncbi:DUF1320 family protein [Porphyromonadaceae bacterium W3.11]|nr:DUF1320 family protein [Porphyromonadaceae bacterium W3.11]